VSQPTVMIVDDEPGLLTLFSGLLKRIDCHVLQATGGAAAIELLERHVPDLIVLDLAMPKVSGVDVLRYIMDTPALASMRVIILTAQGAARFPEELAPGIDEWVSKPVLPTDFLDIVERLLYA
jgi:CheY-like chemotaxis protein